MTTHDPGKSAARATTMSQTDRAFRYGLAIGIEASASITGFTRHDWLLAVLAGVTALSMFAVFLKLRRRSTVTDG